MHQVCASGACAVTQSAYSSSTAAKHSSCIKSTTAASSVSRSYHRVSTHGVSMYVWLVHSRKSNDNNIPSRPMQQSNTHRRTSCQAYKAYSSSNSSTSYISLERLFSPFSTSDGPGVPSYSNPIPKGNLVHKINTYGYINILYFVYCFRHHAYPEDGHNGVTTPNHRPYYAPS